MTKRLDGVENTFQRLEEFRGVWEIETDKRRMNLALLDSHCSRLSMSVKWSEIMRRMNVQMDEDTWNEIEGVREWKGKDYKGFYTIDKDGREHGWV